MIPGLKRVLFPYDPADPVHLLEGVMHLLSMLIQWAICWRPLSPAPTSRTTTRCRCGYSTY